jgi:parvulin-like peptidyl-prolyl cis-trans isomerase-like protein
MRREPDSMIETIKRLLREPLLHFLLLGAGLFRAYSQMSRNSSGEPGKIVITQGQLASLMDGFARTRQRPPTPEEWKGLIRDRVREEVLYREALALGLDKDDIIIRRRLQQKMQFVTDDIVAQIQPTDDELNTYLKAHPDTFRAERRWTFSQVYLNPEKHGETLARDTARLLAQLNQAGGKADVSTLGDSLLLEHSFKAVPGSEVARQFGDKFATTLGELAPGQWQGPVESGYGTHLVFVSERTEGRAPALAEVRDAVMREWTNTQRLEANEKFYQELLKHYTVTIEAPQPVEELKKLAVTQ